MHDPIPGQAEGLSSPETRPVRVLAVASGKGGVGKTNVAVNLALAMQLAEQRTMLLDADLGMGNVDVLLGLQPQFNLMHVLGGHCTLDEALLEGPLDLAIVPAASGKQRMADLGHAEHIGLVNAFSSLTRPLDTLIIDTAAGISDSVVTFSRAAQEVLVVACNEPASLTDAYALIKVLSREHGIPRVHVVANMVKSAAEGFDVYESLKRVAARFLDVRIEYLGHVPHDDFLRRAVQRQRGVVEAYPGAPSSVAFRELAARILRWPLPSGARGDTEFFVERVVGGGVAA
ncbi:MinD/ParA family protein [Algiphilus sp.]|uniref:MinD/ParA family protein n=1 Tax=Algiphilus sp. TaxID=1872431 RepID=UPI0025C3EA66|nr:MinD/ParA family protein [Algiphilus sp.]MCK5771051.1 MinD/ParA family protein [Algiphilus sp.]